jgi:hypothetical protein
MRAREGRDVVVTCGSTYENRANLAPGFFDQVIRKYEDTDGRLTTSSAGRSIG